MASFCVERFSKRSMHPATASYTDPDTSHVPCVVWPMPVSARRAELGNQAISVLAQKFTIFASILSLNESDIASSTLEAFRALISAFTAVRNIRSLTSPSSVAPNARVSALADSGEDRLAPCLASVLCDERIENAACGFSDSTPSPSPERVRASPALTASIARVNRPTFLPIISTQIASPRSALAKSSTLMSSCTQNTTSVSPIAYTRMKINVPSRFESPRR